MMILNFYAGKRKLLGLVAMAIIGLTITGCSKDKDSSDQKETPPKVSSKKQIQQRPTPEPFLILSDFDDTLKVSQTTNKLKLFYNGIAKKKFWLGMNTLVGYWQEKSAKIDPNFEGSLFHIVSASPTFIRPIVKKQIKKLGIERYELTLRNWFKQKDTVAFKEKVLFATIKQDLNRDKKLILVGDNSDSDPEVFNSVLTVHASNIEQIYVHTVRPPEEKFVDDKTIHWLTTFDIALGEWQAGRLSTDQVVTIGQEILETKKGKHLIPKWAYCPTDWEFKKYRIDFPERIEILKQNVRSKIIDICAMRKKR